MPKRTDIDSILVIGAGPIVIGQACEFDYSGTQAIKALKDEGYRVVLVNSNPATIMTDPDLADATYVEPITPEIVAKIIEQERAARPHDKLVLLPTMGGQTALNTALSLRMMGVLDKFDIEMIGAKAEAIDKAEDRELFREAMRNIGLETPRSLLANASALKHEDKKKHQAELDRIATSTCRRRSASALPRPSSRTGRPARPSGASAIRRRAWSRRSTRCRRSACRRSSAPPSRSAAPAAASPSTARSSSRSSSAGWTPRRPPRC